MENNVLKNLLSHNNMDDYKTIDKVIAYERESFPVKCIDIRDLKTDTTDANNNNITKCTKFIKSLGDPNDQFKDECPMGSTPLISQNICIAQQYDAVCPDGLDKIGNNCYKPCNTNYITVDIQKVNDYVDSNNGSKCVNNNLQK